MMLFDETMQRHPLLRITEQLSACCGRMSRLIVLRVVAPAVTVATLAWGCGVVAVAQDSLVGPAADPDFHRTILVEPGYRSPDDIEALAEPVIADSAASGHRIAIRILAGGNASTARAVDLAVADDGDLRRRARNQFGRQEEAERNTRAVTAAIGAALAALADANPTGPDTGSDLFGAIRRAATSPVTPDEVILITGGGVQRSAQLDLLEGYRHVPEMVRAIPEIRAPETDLIVLGVADFSGGETIPSIAFTDAVTQVWEAACGIWVLRSCTLATDAAVLDELEDRRVSSASPSPAVVARAPAEAHRASAGRRRRTRSHVGVASPRWLVLAFVLGLAACQILGSCSPGAADRSDRAAPGASAAHTVVGGAPLPLAETLDGEIPGIETFVVSSDEPDVDVESSPSARAAIPVDEPASSVLPAPGHTAPAVPGPPSPAPSPPSPASSPPSPASSPPSPASSPPSPASSPPSPASSPPSPASSPSPLPAPAPETIGGAASPVPEPAGEPPEQRRSTCQGFRVGDVLFESGTATLADTAAGSLEALVQQIPGGTEIRIVGHTDDIPISIGNETLSELRAHAVAHALVEAGMDPAAISEIVGKGDTEPVADNDSTEKRRQNRRVEVLVSCPAEAEGSSAGWPSPAASACASSSGCHTSTHPEGVWLAFVLPWRRLLSGRLRRRSKPALPVRKLRASKEPTCADGLARMTFLQMVAAALGPAWRRIRGARARLLAQLVHLERGIAHAEREVERALVELAVAREAAKGQSPPQRSARLMAVITGALLIGDIAVVSNALLVRAPQMAPWEGYITALAFSISLVVVGYLLGERLHPERQGRRLLWALLFTLAVVGVSLYLLRQNVEISWIFLSIFPALGAAAAKAGGRSAEQREVVQRERALRRAESRLEQAQDRFDRTLGRASELEEISIIMLMSELLDARSQLMPLGLDEPFPSVAKMVDETAILQRLEQRAVHAGGTPTGFDRTTADMVDRAMESTFGSPAQGGATGSETDGGRAANGAGNALCHGSPGDREGTADDAAHGRSLCRVCGKSH